MKRLSSKTIKLASGYFKVLSESNRIKILNSLYEEPLHVAAIVRNTGLSQPIVSKHLKILMTFGLLKRHKDGTLAFYEIIDFSVFAMLEQAGKHAADLKERQFASFSGN